MVVKIYGSYKSACTLRVLACLAEKDVDYEMVKLDLEAGEHKKPDFLLRQVLVSLFGYFWFLRNVLSRDEITQVIIFMKEDGKKRRENFTLLI